MCVFKYHAFIFLIRPPRWQRETQGNTCTCNNVSSGYNIIRCRIKVRIFKIENLVGVQSKKVHRKKVAANIFFRVNVSGHFYIFYNVSWFKILIIYCEGIQYIFTRPSVLNLEIRCLAPKRLNKQKVLKRGSMCTIIFWILIPIFIFDGKFSSFSQEFCSNSRDVSASRNRGIELAVVKRVCQIQKVFVLSSSELIRSIEERS